MGYLLKKVLQGNKGLKFFQSTCNGFSLNIFKDFLKTLNAIALDRTKKYKHIISYNYLLMFWS